MMNSVPMVSTPAVANTVREETSVKPLQIVILGLSITSSWGNGHATTYRSLVRALADRGHQVVFLERDVPWYATNRDLPHPPFGATYIYSDLADLKQRFTKVVREADLVILGSFVPQGVAVGEWILEQARGLTAFYDIDTPVTLAKLARGDGEYITPGLIPRFHFYLSFSGGDSLDKLEKCYGARTAYPFYCSVDPALYYPEPAAQQEGFSWALGYMGTYSDDRQPAVEELLLAPARGAHDMHFVVAGPMYPDSIEWPANVERICHIPPNRHRGFYNRQRFTLNITRRDMVAAGHSPSVRLFEAAACGTPIISDYWRGLEDVFEIGSEILVAKSRDEVLDHISNLTEQHLRAIGNRARKSVLAHHSSESRAQQLEDYVAVEQ